MNKQIIPFCVDAKEENLTEEQIRQLHAWCLEVGADLDESADDWLEDVEDYNYLGIDQMGATLSHLRDYYFNENVIKYKDVRKCLGLDNVNVTEEGVGLKHHVHTKQTEQNTIDKQTLIQYANTLSSDITICPNGSYRVFMEVFEQDVELKTDEDLHEFVKAYQKLMKFVD